MSATPPPSAAPKKLCSRCGEDVANKPRVKDAQGRYYCKPCQAALSAGSGPPPAITSAPAAPVTLPTTGDDPWLKLIEQGAAQVKATCPGCNAPQPTDTVVCTRCGYNRSLGKQVRTKVAKAPKEERAARSGRRRRGNSLNTVAMILESGAIIPGLYLLCAGGLGLAALSSRDAVLPFLAVSAVFYLFVWIFGLVRAAMDNILHALAAFLCGFYWLYYAIARSEHAMLRNGALVMIINIVLYYMIMAQHPDMFGR